MSAEEMLDKDQLKKLLDRPNRKQIRWRESIIFMINKGINRLLKQGQVKFYQDW